MTVRGTMARRDDPAHRARLAVVRPLDRRLVLRPHKATLDQERAVAVDADEGARAGDLGRIIDVRPLVERGQRLLDLAETRIDLVRQLVGVLILRFELRLFGAQRVDGRLLLVGDVGGRAVELPQAVIVAIREARRRPRSTSSLRPRSSRLRPSASR